MDALLTHGADPYACHSDETEMALFYAANHERPYSNAAVELILSHGMDINARDPWGDTCLLRAAHICQADVAEVLLSHGADPNIAPEHGGRYTALHHAACQEDAKLCKLLLAHGADTAAEDSRVSRLFIMCKHAPHAWLCCTCSALMADPDTMHSRKVSCSAFHCSICSAPMTNS
ncbi:hypothetical protein ABBQ38_005724 [Trebouxia sp. C0009 RCD-2024]